MLDGYLAKTFGWTSDVGKWLDPLADKLLLVSVFITLAWIALVPVWLATVAVTRDFVIGIGAGVYKWLFGPVEGRPTVPSKLNTLVQLLFVIAVVWHAAFPEFPEWAVIALGAGRPAQDLWKCTIPGHLCLRGSPPGENRSGHASHFWPVKGNDCRKIDGMKEKILIVGTGAMGSLFAARLALAGLGVTMLGTWKEGLQAIRSDGVRFLDADGQEHRLAVQATDDPRACAGTQFALVLVKAWQTERAARQLAECLSPDGLAVTLQNGLGNREALMQSLTPGRVALGVTTTGATLLKAGQVKARGEGQISIERSMILKNYYQKSR